MAPLMTTLDSTVVNVALSTLGREMEAPLSTIQWVASGYLLALALMLPLNGWLVDRIGAKRLYLACFTAFTLASLACGLTKSATGLISARVAQGLAGGLLAPMAQMMIAREAGRHMARVAGLMSVPVLLGPILGPSLAGAILQHASWRWIFFINVPIGVVALALAVLLLPNDKALARPRALDLMGFLLLAPGLALLLHSMEGLVTATASPGSWGKLGFALALLVAFLFWNLRRGSDALLDLSLLRRPTFGAAASTQFFANAVSFGGQMLLPLYLLNSRHLPVAQVGGLLAAQGLGMLVLYPFMGPLTERWGNRWVSVCGVSVALLGTLPFALGLPGGPLPWVIGAALFIRGMGQAAIGMPSMVAAYSVVQPHELAGATTTMNIIQRLGGPLATTLLAVTLHAMLRSTADPIISDTAYAMVFRLYCAIHIAAALSALRLPLRAYKKANTNEDPVIDLNAD
jgi:EmrB/QacA subfamily drug resistance transporter